MSDKKPTYEDIRHDLDTNILRASSIESEQEKQAFVNQMFVGIHQHYKERHVYLDDYLKLVNRLAAYKQGAYNDYLDTLVGAARLGVLDLALSGAINVSPEMARRRSKLVDELTGTQPSQPDEE